MSGSRGGSADGVDRAAVFDVIAEVEEEILAEDKLGVSRDQIVEGTCQRIRDRLRDLDDDEPTEAVEISEEEAIDELGGAAATAEIDEDDLFTDGGRVQDGDEVAHDDGTTYVLEEVDDAE